MEVKPRRKHGIIPWFGRIGSDGSDGVTPGNWNMESSWLDKDLGREFQRLDLIGSTMRRQIGPS